VNLLIVVVVVPNGPMSVSMIIKGSLHVNLHVLFYVYGLGIGVASLPGICIGWALLTPEWPL